MNIVCVGDCGVDHYLPSSERLFGGITANFARHARKQFPPGDRVQIVSCVGDDEGGDLVLSSLQNSGIDCHIARLPGATPVQYIEIQPDGEKDFVRYDEGVLRDFVFEDAEREIIRQSDLLVAPVFLQIVGLFDELMSIETDGLISIDFADFLQHPNFGLFESHIDRIDIGFFGLSADNTETIGRIAELAKRHRKLFVVTLGAEGSRAFYRDEIHECAAIPVDEVVDTTGAGDAFGAGFLNRYLHGCDVGVAMLAGSMAAARVVAHIGAFQR